MSRNDPFVKIADGQYRGFVNGREFLLRRHHRSHGTRRRNPFGLGTYRQQRSTTWYTILEVVAGGVIEYTSVFVEPTTLYINPPGSLVEAKQLVSTKLALGPAPTLTVKEGK